MVSFTQVDAFTDTALRGNPAAVVIVDLGAATDDDWMQLVAREMNLSETAFCFAGGGSEQTVFGLRWFTPTQEVDLCGHATLATAHTLWESGIVDRGLSIDFDTLSGHLPCRRDGDWIDMDFPARPPVEMPAPDGLAAALGSVPAWTGRNERDLFAVLDREAAVRDLTPDLAALAGFGALGVSVTARSKTTGIDFVSRFFAPAAGVDEDPVTGSAHTGLGPLWSERLGRSELTGFQASARGGTVRMQLREAGRIGIAGQAVTTVRGELLC